MIFPTILLLSLPFLASAVPQHSVNPHLTLAGRLVNTRDVADECPTCTSFATTVAACVQLTSTEEMGACLCTTQVFNDLNTCIECPAVTSSTSYADLVDSSQQISSSCAQLGVTGLPAIDSIPPATAASTSSPESDTAVASDAASTTAGGESAPNTIATSAAKTTTSHSGTTTTKAVASPTSKASTKAPSSASASASASVVASFGFKSVGGASIFVGAAGVVGIWAALI